MTGVRLRFALLEKAWTLALGSDLRFPMQDPLVPLKFEMPQQGSEARALGLKEVDVSLDMKNGDHSAVARLGVGFGDSKRGPPSSQRSWKWICSAKPKR